jgi:hypothetical protein
MIITFGEKENKQYEVQDEHVETIFDDVKNEVNKILEKYMDNNRDLLITLSSLGSIYNSLNQRIINDFGADQIIETLQAKEIESE